MRSAARNWWGWVGAAGLVGATGCLGGESPDPGGGRAELVLDASELSIVPWWLAVEGDVAFVTSAESPNGRVVRVPLDGTPASVLASGLDLPTGIVVEGGELYVVTSTELLRLPADGSAAPVVVATSALGFGPTLAVDGTHVYWTEPHEETGAVRRVARAGGAVETLIEGEGTPSGLALHRGRVFWTNFGSGEVRSANLDGSDVRTLATEQASPGVGLAASDDGVFWFNEGAIPSEVVMAPLEGGAPLVLGAASTREFGYSSSVVLHGAHVYVRTPIVEDGTCGIALLPIAGGDAESVDFDPSFGCPLFLTSAGPNLYFTFPGGVTRLELR
jgi:sugar lactone lactonase YvrE